MLEGTTTYWIRQVSRGFTPRFPVSRGRCDGSSRRSASFLRPFSVLTRRFWLAGPRCVQIYPQLLHSRGAQGPFQVVRTFRARRIVPSDFTAHTEKRPPTEAKLFPIAP